MDDSFLTGLPTLRRSLLMEFYCADHAGICTPLDWAAVEWPRLSFPAGAAGRWWLSIVQVVWQDFHKEGQPKGTPEGSRRLQDQEEVHKSSKMMAVCSAGPLTLVLSVETHLAARP